MVRSARLLSVCSALALLVAGCSNGGGKHSTPTTARQAVVNLGPCPKTDRNLDWTKVNAGVKGLDRALVPITAIRVRMCRYDGGLVGERTMVRPANVARFEAEANGSSVSLPTTTTTPSGVPGLTGSQGLIGSAGCFQTWRHVVTFASATQRVVLYESCGGVGNGILSGSSFHWSEELQNYTAPVSGFAQGEMHIQGGRPDGKPHDQPLPGVVVVHRLGKSEALTKVTVGSTGAFNIALPNGSYQLVGHPANTGIMSMTSKPFTIHVGLILHVDLIELAN